jgi:hypothetical protein
MCTCALILHRLVQFVVMTEVLLWLPIGAIEPIRGYDSLRGLSVFGGLTCLTIFIFSISMSFNGMCVRVCV